MGDAPGKRNEVRRFVDGQIANLMQAGLTADMARIKIGLYCGSDRLVAHALDSSYETRNDVRPALWRNG